MGKGSIYREQMSRCILCGVWLVIISLAQLWRREGGMVVLISFLLKYTISFPMSVPWVKPSFPSAPQQPLPGCRYYWKRRCRVISSSRGLGHMLMVPVGPRAWGGAGPPRTHPACPPKDHDVLAHRGTNHLLGPSPSSRRLRGKSAGSQAEGCDGVVGSSWGRSWEEGPLAPQTEGKRSRQVSPSPRFLSSHRPQPKMVATPELVLVTSTLSSSQPEL